MTVQTLPPDVSIIDNSNRDMMEPLFQLTRSVRGPWPSCRHLSTFRAKGGSWPADQLTDGRRFRCARSRIRDCEAIAHVETTECIESEDVQNLVIAAVENRIRFINTLPSQMNG
jgi:hypothetical protein